MNKLKNMLIAVIAITSLSVNAFAGNFGAGVTGSMAFITGTGTERDKDVATDTVGRDGTAQNVVGVGSIFAEYTFDGFGGMTLGVDYIPGSADVNHKKVSRLDTNSLDSTEDNGTRTAQAEIENHLSYYAELPLGGSGFYAKAGYVTMDVNTSEALLNSTVYGNTSVDGLMYGAGIKQDLGESAYYKLEGSMTEFDTLKLNDNVTDKGNKISADLDVARLTFAVGIKF